MSQQHHYCYIHGKRITKRLYILALLPLFLKVFVTLIHKKSKNSTINHKYSSLPSIQQDKRRLILESIDENDKSSPKLAWLLSYPMSGESDVISYIHNVTKKATASNYGHIMYNEFGRVVRSTFVSIPVFKMRTNGPFLSTHHLEMSNKFIPVVSHCGGYCNACNPGRYILRRDDFIASCSATIRFTPDIGLDGPIEGSGTYEELKYTTALIQKALVLIRNPFHTIQDRFIQYSHGYERGHQNINEIDEQWFTKYQLNDNGFHLYCFDEAVRYVDEEKKWFESDDLKVLMNVTCHAEFYRWVKWHNLLFDSLDYLNIPYEILHYDDLFRNTADNSMDGDTAIGRKTVLDFFELHEIKNDDSSDHLLYYKGDFKFIKNGERDRAINMIKRFATEKTWKESMRYFNLDPNLLQESQ